MSIDLSKIGYGVVFAAESGGGVVISKIGYGVIIDTLHDPPPETGRRRNMTFHP